MTVDFNFVLVDQDLWGIGLKRPLFKTSNSSFARSKSSSLRLPFMVCLGAAPRTSPDGGFAAVDRC